MRRKLWIVLVAGFAIFLINDLHVFGPTGVGVFFDLGISAWITYRAWTLISVSMNSSEILLKSKPASSTFSGGLSPAWVTALCFLLVMNCFAYRIMAAAGLNFFVWGDHVFGAGGRLWPVLTWSVAGLALGAVTGSVVFWRKYHISFKRCLVLIVPIVLLLYFFRASSGPLGTVIPAPLALAADTQKIMGPAPVQISPRRKQHRTRKPARKADTALNAAEPVPECERGSGEITINARTDSVNIYYRLSAYKDAPWGPWRSKFIAQQGQFSLTEDGPVFSNGLQYYYENHSVLTRSAQNPYTKILCDGPLVIDTY